MYYQRIAEVEKDGIPAAVAVIVSTSGSVPRREGTKMVIFDDGTFEGTIGGGEVEHRVIKEALESLQESKSRIVHYRFVDVKQGDVGVCGGEMDVYIEPIRSALTLVVVGAGHVGKEVARLGKWLGYRVVVVDDRRQFATQEMVPDADELLNCEISQIPEHVTITDQTYIVFTTRGTEIDVDGLPGLIDSPAAYIGVIGSRRRWEVSAQQLFEKGINKEQLSRIHSPVGLDLNAETPQEIAVSILAQMIMVRHSGTGKSKQHTPVLKMKRK
ncbi:MAG: XdhC family protein [Anaerolineales bacterium]|nr:XdhC family protein [Anaerolineales bacterium]